MFRRRPVTVRRGPGLIGTVAQTAVIAGTATAVSKGVSGSMDARGQAKQQAAANAMAAEAAAQQTQADVEQLQSQLATLQAQQAQATLAAQPPAAPAAAPAGGGDLLAQLQQLTHLKEAGMLSDDEFTAAKAKLLAG
ncbi:MAG: SHOCT domain-containing protein [Chloroflexi bacterium]|nr:SHOCT domain-containing protein [Chloroflexota bacterium]